MQGVRNSLVYFKLWEDIILQGDDDDGVLFSQDKRFNKGDCQKIVLQPSLATN